MTPVFYVFLRRNVPSPIFVLCPKIALSLSERGDRGRRRPRYSSTGGIETK